MTPSVSCGLHLPHFGRLASPDFMSGVAVAAERLGFASLWVSDHVVVPVELHTPYPYRDDGVIHLDHGQPFHDPFALLSWLAALTERVELGIGAFVVPYRRPLVAAKLIGTADQLSGGRTRMVAGAGWMEEEFDALGVPFEARGAITDEVLDLLVAAFAATPLELPTGPVGVEPRPMRQPYPLMVGGHSSAAMRRALRLGHGWQGTPQRAGEMAELVERLADVAGGDIPDGFVVSTRLHLSRFDPETAADEVRSHVSAALVPRIDELVLSITDTDEGRFHARLEALAEWLGVAATGSAGGSAGG